MPLRLLLEAIQEHADAHPIERKCLICLGDYVDRGMESRAVLDLLARPPLPGFEHFFLKGNHEDGMLRFIAGDGNALGWIAYGGIATMFSYGVKPPDPVVRGRGRITLRALVELAEKLPAGASRLSRRRLGTLPHRGRLSLRPCRKLKPGIPQIPDQRDEDLLWIREEFLRSDYNFGKQIVHGHTITREADIRTNRIGIDTGAFASGSLTCLVLEGTKRGFARDLILNIAR